MRIAVIALACAAGVAHAEFIDFTGVTLAGTNPYTFTDANVGEVSLTYSGGHRLDGLITQFGGTTTVGLGSTSQAATLTVAWEQPVTSIDIRLYDLDLREYDDFVIAGGTTLSLVAASPFGPANPLNGLRVSGTVSDLPNSSTSNYTTVRIAGDAFTEFSVTFIRPNASGGGHSIGFGEFVVVPAPAGVAGVTAMSGLVTVRRRRERLR